MIEKKDSFLTEVTSTNSHSTMFQIALNAIREKKKIDAAKNMRHAIMRGYSFREFCALLMESGNCVLQNKGLRRSFVIDQYLEPILQQLYLYSICSSEFQGNLSLGIMLQGKYGCGKSLLMESYAHLHNFLIRQFEWSDVPSLTFLRAIELQDQIKERGVKFFDKRPLIIDEFGRESKTLYDFGNVSRPISELLSLRGDTGAITHGTTNFSLETLCSGEFYGQMIGDRLRVMFNLIEMKGETRRV